MNAAKNANTLPFLKMSSLGNDILVIPGDAALNEQLVQRLCHRRHGISCDQVMTLSVPMEIWNQDGTRARACGNGTRCVMALLQGFLEWKASAVKKSAENFPSRNIWQLSGPGGILKGWLGGDNAKELPISQGKDTLHQISCSMRQGFFATSFQGSQEHPGASTYFPEFLKNFFQKEGVFWVQQGVAFCIAGPGYVGKNTGSISLEALKVFSSCGDSGHFKSASFGMFGPFPAYHPWYLWGQEFWSKIPKEDHAFWRVLSPGFIVDVGNLHWILFADHFSSIDAVGEILTHHPAFPHGVNVSALRGDAASATLFSSFVPTWHITTWERGAGKTLGCGSGACAAALVIFFNASKKMAQPNPYPTLCIKSPGGDAYVKVAPLFKGDDFFSAFVTHGAAVRTEAGGLWMPSG